MDSMFDEEASSDDETVNSDVRTIRKQLEGLETMYSEVCDLNFFHYIIGKITYKYFNIGVKITRGS